MSSVSRMLASLQRRQPAPVLVRPQGMQVALDKKRMAELQLAQAATLEELDLGRSLLQQANAEIQHLIRLAKRDRGVPVRDLDEVEAMFRQLLTTLKRRPAGSP